MYLPLIVDVTGHIEKKNSLYVYFHSPNRVVRQRLAAQPEELRRHFENISVIRKSTQDFGDFGGVT
ncbi:MAG: hypothetical protein RSC98_08895, partial [Clostridia bacterium]